MKKKILLKKVDFLNYFRSHERSELPVHLTFVCDLYEREREREYIRFRTKVFPPGDAKIFIEQSPTNRVNR